MQPFTHALVARWATQASVAANPSFTTQLLHQCFAIDANSIGTGAPGGAMLTVVSRTLDMLDAPLTTAVEALARAADA